MQKILKLLEGKRILVVSHDVGGSNIIKNFFDHYRIKAKFYLRGPALKIFKRKKIDNLTKNIKAAEIIITGTGWQSNLEYKAINGARKYNKICLTFLDHWTNYEKRFKRNGKIVLPNKIIVFDKYSESNIKKIFKNKVDIVRSTNFYFKNFIKKQKKQKKQKIFNNILYLSSNYDQVLKKKIDILLLKNFIEKISNLKAYKRFGVDIKPHPTENFKKYFNVKKNNKKIRKIIVNKKLEEVLSGYKIVAGTETSGLVLAKICKLKTINNVFNSGIKKSLPKKYISVYI